MTTRRRFLLTLGASLLSAKTLWAMPADAPPAPGAADVVRQYLAFHATHEWTKAYVLLSPDTQQMLPLSEFAETKHFPADPAADGMTPTLAAVSAMFIDAGDTLGYTFQVAGLSPDDPHTVLVSAQPRSTGPADAAKSLLLRVVTISDPKVGNAPRIAMMATLERTSPVEFVHAREAARQTSSLSNLKQISLGIIVYAQEHQEALPHANDWVDAITPYLNHKDKSPAENARIIASLFRDPSAPAGQTWCYAFNSHLSGLKLKSIGNPASTVMLFETTKNVKNTSDTGQSIPRPSWHSGGTEYAFADGHVRWLPDKDRPDFGVG